MTISADRVKEIFTALSLHFRSNYNYLKYNGHLSNVTAKVNEFWCVSLSKRLNTEENIELFFIANIVNTFTKENRIETFGGNYNNRESFIIYESYKKIDFNEYFDYYINSNDILELIKVKPSDSLYPELYQRFIDGTVRLEFIVCLYILMPKLFEFWKSKVDDPVLFPEFLKFCERYRLLLKINTKQLTTTFKQKVQNTHV